MSPAPLVEMNDVHVRRGERLVLAGVMLALSPGERLGIVGPNGAGKSTLLEVMVGALRADAGDVRILRARPPSPRLGFVPQSPGSSLMPWYAVRDNVTLPLRVRGVSRRGRDRAFDEVRERVDPRGRIDPDARPQTLSGGQRQLVALMRALVDAPRLLVCDEPFAALDEPTRQHVRSVLTTVCGGGEGAGLVLVTHEVADLDALVDRVERMDGRPATLRPLPAVVGPGGGLRWSAG